VVDKGPDLNGLSTKLDTKKKKLGLQNLLPERTELISIKGGLLHRVVKLARWRRREFK